MEALNFFIYSPILLLFTLLLILFGYMRTKRERKMFHVRIEPWNKEIKRGLFHGIFSGFAVSLILFGFGVVLSPDYLLALAILFTVLLVVGYSRLLTPAYFLLGAVFVLFLLEGYVDQVTLSNETLLGLLLLATLLLFVEALFIQRQSKYQASPVIQKTPRGRETSSFKHKQWWLLPVVLLVPGDWFESFSTLWPVFSIGESGYAVVLFPFVIGTAYHIKSSYPDAFMERVSRHVFVLSILSLIFTMIAYMYPPFALVGLGLLAIGRLFINSWNVRQDRQGDVHQIPEGLTIVSLLPETAAVDLGLKVGETIAKVNGERVYNEKEFYDALQKNAAHCRLEVIDRNGELRLIQRVLYADDHHRLGLVFMYFR